VAPKPKLGVDEPKPNPKPEAGVAGVVGSVGLAASGFAGVVVAGVVPKPKVLEPVAGVVVAVPGLSGVVPAAGVAPNPNVLEVPVEPKPKVLAVLLPDVPKPKLPVPVAGVLVDGAVAAVGVVVVPVVGAGFVVSVFGEVVAPVVVALGAPKEKELPNVVPAGFSVDGADVPGLVPGEPLASDVLVVAAGLVVSVVPNANVLEVAGLLSVGFLSPTGPPNENVLEPSDDNEPNPRDEDPLVPVDGAVVAAGLLVSDVLGAPNPNELVPGLLASVVPKPNDPEVPNGFVCSAGFGETFTAPGRGPVVSK
jgi:hypothetical protein